MFKKVLAGFMLFTLFIPTTLAVGFSDVPNVNNHYLAINYLAAQKVVKGYANNVFKPEQLVNRAEALKIIFTGTKIVLPSNVSGDGFKDVKSSAWYGPYVIQAKALKIVSGNADGTFAPGRDISRAEFIKMLLVANSFKPEKWVDQNLFKDIPKGQWFTPYMNYAGQAGIVLKDEKGNLRPNEKITRGEVAEILYLMTIIRNGNDTKFLLGQAQAHLGQIDVYIDNGNLKTAKHTTELAVDMTQQALKNMPANKTVLSTAKLARAYSFLVNATIAAGQKKYDESKSLINQAITKATEAWEADHDSQTLARHIKDRCKGLLAQMPGAIQEVSTQAVSTQAVLNQ